jgi:glyoxylase-like metal-dependent hydrolase (beta-lactamase superfamily II)
MVEASITVVDRGHVRTDVNHVIEGFQTATASNPDPDPVRSAGPVFNLVIDHPEATILWDSGSHPEAGDGYWPEDLYDAFEHYDAADHPLPDALDDAGYALDDIDAVVQSHLHLDHAGGLRHFAGTDTPIYVHERELEFAYRSAVSDTGDGAYVKADFDHDLNWQVVTQDPAAHFTDLEFVHLPGHTPGLIGVVIDHDTHGTLVVAGDLAYARANYEGEVPLGAGLLWDRPAWLDSVARVKDIQRRRDARVFVGHDEDDVARLRDL